MPDKNKNKPKKPNHTKKAIVYSQEDGFYPPKKETKRVVSKSMRFSKGGKVKKEKEPLKNKVKRKISQVKNRKVEKAFKRTRNTDLQDKPRSGNSGVYNKGGFIQFN